MFIENFFSQRSGKEVWSPRESRRLCQGPENTPHLSPCAPDQGGSRPCRKQGHRTSWSGTIRETGISPRGKPGRQGISGYHQGLGQGISNIQGAPGYRPGYDQFATGSNMVITPTNRYAKRHTRSRRSIYNNKWWSGDRIRAPPQA